MLVRGTRWGVCVGEARPGSTPGPVTRSPGMAKGTLQVWLSRALGREVILGHQVAPWSSRTGLRTGRDQSP